MSRSGEAAEVAVTNNNDARLLLLISNSTLHGMGYLDHAEAEIGNLVESRTRVVFIPFALHDRRAYAEKAQQRFRGMGLVLTSVHDVSNMARAILEAEAIFVGGGNTFRLLKALYDFNLLEPIRDSVAAGTPFIGSSAGAIVAGLSLKTTKDRPVVQPPSFQALGLVPFQISPHYLDPDPSSTHMGETQEERILQFLEENEARVVGLREGSMLAAKGDIVELKGPHTARIFRRGENPVEVTPGSDLHALLESTPSLAGLPS
jgi:dipeptidase E